MYNKTIIEFCRFCFVRSGNYKCTQQTFPSHPILFGLGHISKSSAARDQGLFSSIAKIPWVRDWLFSSWSNTVFSIKISFNSRSGFFHVSDFILRYKENKIRSTRNRWVNVLLGIYMSSAADLEINLLPFDQWQLSNFWRCTISSVMDKTYLFDIFGSLFGRKLHLFDSFCQGQITDLQWITLWKENAHARMNIDKKTT